MNEIKDIKKLILSVLKGGDILFIVPPFGSINDVALGPHILQALAEENGYKTDILYLNILLASIIGGEHYENIYQAPEFWMLAERLFARSAYDLPPLGNNPQLCADEAMSVWGDKTHQKMFYDVEHSFDLNSYLETESICKLFIDESTTVITSLDYKLIGCTASMMRQTNCSIALLEGVKKNSPETITILGGSDCRSEMAKGITSLSESIDYIFSGESENTFLNFLKDYSTQELPSKRIIIGKPLDDLDTLPIPDYEIFSLQTTCFLGDIDLKKTKIWYETSRGCWWAQCAFCSEHQKYRKKSAKKAAADIKRIGELYRGKTLFLTDINMPPSYHHDLLPIISKSDVFPSCAYQLKANLPLKEMVSLKNAKVNFVLSGIETFSTRLLNLVNKGITATQGLLFLRNAFSVGIYVDWFLLWRFPGDSVSDYEEVLRILPLIRHLQPPREFFPMLLTRFSHYFKKHQEYKMTDLRPWAAYHMIFPEVADIDKLAYYYTAEYFCESHESPGVIQQIADEVKIWQGAWKKSKLVMIPFSDHYLIYDNREMGEVKKHVVEHSKAKGIITDGAYIKTENQQWALEKKLGLVIDSWYVPLITASQELLLKFHGHR